MTNNTKHVADWAVDCGECGALNMVVSTKTNPDITEYTCRACSYTGDPADFPDVWEFNQDGNPERLLEIHNAHPKSDAFLNELDGLLAKHFGLGYELDCLYKWEFDAEHLMINLAVPDGGGN